VVIGFLALTVGTESGSRFKAFRITKTELFGRIKSSCDRYGIPIPKHTGRVVRLIHSSNVFISNGPLNSHSPTSANVLSRL
jgi:hypothetical protein